MATTENPHAGRGMVVLDIGGDIGAVIISVPETIAGEEIEICPAGRREQTPDEGNDWWDGDWHSHSHQHSHDDAAPGHSHGPAWPHVAVIARPVATGIEYSAVYPGLRSGRYDVWIRPDRPTALTLTVTGGQVTEASWPTR
jgi:hypothetical protein